MFGAFTRHPVQRSRTLLLVAGVLVCSSLTASQRVSASVEEIREVRQLLNQTETAETNQRIEWLLNRLQLSEDASFELRLLDARIEAHAAMLRRYRAKGVETGVRKHAEWLVRAERTVSPVAVGTGAEGRATRPVDRAGRLTLRAARGQTFLEAYLEVIRMSVAAGDQTGARRWLADADRNLIDIPGARARLKDIATKVSKED